MKKCYPGNIVDGKVVGTGEVVDGVAVIPTSLDKTGDYIVELEYLGNGNYTESDTALDVEVVPRVASIGAVQGSHAVGNSTVVVNLTDAETGEPLVGATVVVTLPNGTEVTGIIGEDGTAVVPVDLPLGTYDDLPVRFDGNETYAPVDTTVDVEILPRSTVTSPVTNNVAGNVTLDVHVTDAETGADVTNGNVTV